MTFDSNCFDYSRSECLFTSEGSSLGIRDHLQTLCIRSSRTGVVKQFEFQRHERDDEGEILYTVYAGDIMDVTHYVIIYND